MITGRRILITGAARGIGAATARRLHERGAHLALVGIEPEQLEEVAAACGNAPFFDADVTDREGVTAAIDEAAERLGGLDVVVANAGVAAQLPLIGGDPEIFERTIAVNVVGVYNTLRAAGPHIAHEHGYALPIASLAAALHLPLLGAYSSSKAAVEALGNVLRIELRGTGARVGVGYFAEIDTDMTTRGFGTDAANALMRKMRRPVRAAPLSAAVDAIERGIDRRSRRVFAPRWVGGLLPTRMVVQRGIELAIGDRAAEALEIARHEHAGLTTPQPERQPH
jgi:NAD(P)-dependent dehydrogenase (short-subunit alcohol dehydrogenase family)